MTGGDELISISRLLCDYAGPGDHLRYQKKESPRPVVVWNCTKRCNLRCVHCYASANDKEQSGEIDTAGGEALINDLAEFGAPVILFSGGEPLMRPDIYHLADYAKGKGLRVALSTNGTLVTKEVAERLKGIGFSEVGISLDGIGDKNDKFRGKVGAYDSALEGIRNSLASGLRVSLRLTITRMNYKEIPAILDVVEQEGINRVCIYHLAYSGRGSNLMKEDISHAQTREVVDLICDRTVDMHKKGLKKEILTVSSHVDGVYLYLKEKKKDPAKAQGILDLLKINGGNNSGIKIGCVDNLGNVHPDQFWWHYSLGNIKQRKFSEIWSDTSEPLLRGLRDRKSLLKGRCHDCEHLDICNGNLRVRAEAVYDDVWAEDPSCYLTNEEIGVKA
jgi:radical SAM protein with 4Fe4S-binding SPASM domain